MATQKKTGFDRYFAKRMADPKFAAEYASARAEIDATDKLIRALDAVREAGGLTKAQLARRIEAKPESIRRLFTSPDSNPTMETVFKVATALGYHLELVANARRGNRRRAPTRQAAKASNEVDLFANMSNRERAKLHASLRGAEEEIAAGKATRAEEVVRGLRAARKPSR